MRVSLSSAGAQANGSSSSNFLAIASSGRFVACISSANHLAEDDTNGASVIFVRDY